jgi:hypothetical protein
LLIDAGASIMQGWTKAEQPPGLSLSDYSILEVGLGVRYNANGGTFVHQGWDVGQACQRFGVWA